MARITIWTLFLGIVCFAIGGRAYHSTGSLVGLCIGLFLGATIGVYFNRSNKTEK
jgi:hypothetical protein